MQFSINGANYSSVKLNVFDQELIARKIMPLIPALAESWDGIMSIDEGLPGLVFAAECAKMAAPFFIAYSSLPESSIGIIQDRCLSVVQMQQDDKWFPIYNAKARMLMFDNIEMLDMNEIIYQVLQDNLSNFFIGLARRGLLGKSLQSRALSPSRTESGS